MTLGVIVLAEVFSVTGLVIWLIIGLIAGFVASRIMGVGGYGLVGDIVVGLIGAFIGGLIANLLIPGATNGLIGSIIVAIIGACLLIWIVRMVTGERRQDVTKVEDRKDIQTYKTQRNSISSTSGNRMTRRTEGNGGNTSIMNAGPLGVPNVEGTSKSRGR